MLPSSRYQLAPCYQGKEFILQVKGFLRVAISPSQDGEQSINKVEHLEVYNTHNVVPPGPQDMEALLEITPPHQEGMSQAGPDQIPLLLRMLREACFWMAGRNLS